MELLKPQHLQTGDTIGVVSTSFPFPTDKNSEYYANFLKGKATLEEMGFKVKLGKNLGKSRWWAGGTPEERADDINNMFADPEIRAIIVHDGGQSAITLLDKINYDLVRKDPKPFLGFSDITNILVALHTQTGLVGFHMALLTYGLGDKWLKYPENIQTQGKEAFVRALTDTNPLGMVKPLTQWECWREGTAEGNLFGGNLSMLTSLVGTKYFPTLEQLKGAILFWETDNSNSYRIERYLYQLKYAGILDVISGMVIGKLVDIKKSTYGDQIEPDLNTLVMESIKDSKFPVLSGVDFGHKIVDLPMLLGLKAKVDATNLKLEILESAVK